MLEESAVSCQWGTRSKGAYHVHAHASPRRREGDRRLLSRTVRRRLEVQRNDGSGTAQLRERERE